MKLSGTVYVGKAAQFQQTHFLYALTWSWHAEKNRLNTQPGRFSLSRRAHTLKALKKKKP